jgi:hypothetical protein
VSVYAFYSVCVCILQCLCMHSTVSVYAFYSVCVCILQCLSPQSPHRNTYFAIKSFSAFWLVISGYRSNTATYTKRVFRLLSTTENFIRKWFGTGMRDLHFPSAPVRYIDSLAAKYLCLFLP